MATNETDLSIHCPDNTTLRAYVAFIIAQTTAMGWVQDSVSGQVTASNAVVPTAVNQNIGFLLFKMNDTLQATTPIYLRITLRSPQSLPTALTTSQGYYLVCLTFQVGFTIDGSGNLTTLYSTQRAITYYSYSSISPATNTITAVDQAKKHLWSGANNRLSFARGVEQTQNLEATAPFSGTFPTVNNSMIKHGFMSIERTKDSNGADTSEGLIFTNAGHMNETNFNTYAYQQQVILRGKPLPQNQYKLWNVAYVGDAANLTLRQFNQLSLLPIKPLYGGQEYHAGICQGAYLQGDFSAWYGEGIPFDVYGTTRLYRPVGRSLFRPILGADAAIHPVSDLMMIWE